MGYWNTSSLNLEVTDRKLKSAMPLPRLSAQIFSSAGTMGRMSVPGARKPCEQRNRSRLCQRVARSSDHAACNLALVSYSPAKVLPAFCFTELHRRSL